MTPPERSAGCFCFVLHAHQPYVLHHGTWPHGLEWLLEAAAETYLPLLRTIRRLHADGIPLAASVSLSPVLLEQLASAELRDELPRYLQRKIAAAGEDAAFFEQANELHLLSLARWWERQFRETLHDLEALGGDLVGAFRAAEESGAIELLTSAATHGYAPLLGTDESLRAQFQTAVAAHQRHLHRKPKGVWLPECGYRPACAWKFPVAPAGMNEPAATERIGVETALQDAGLHFTVVDSHLVEDSEGLSAAGSPNRSLYRPHGIAASSVAAFARDPRSAFQVWSAQFGYPGEFAYLDFHKKRWPGGHRYWRVTGADQGMEAKQPYHPEIAAERVCAHAEHFAGLVAETLRSQPAGSAPAMLCAPFDLELFGHWWHEGIQFLEQVARVLARGDHGVTSLPCGDYLERYGTADSVRMREGSWGSGGDSSVWMNAETGPLLERMYAAELAVRDASHDPRWTDGAEGERLARQMCRELMLMEASDWPTLITTGAARDYAERRFHEHAEHFAALLREWHLFRESGGMLGDEACRLLGELEQQDGIFPDVNPADWRTPAA